MEQVTAVLTKALGAKAAGDFIAASFEVDDAKEIKKRVCALLDTRKLENRRVYEILMREREIRKAFPQEGYRKTDTNPNAPCDTKQSVPVSKRTDKDEENESLPQNVKGKRKPKFYPLFSEGAHSDQVVSLLPGRHPCQCLATKHQLVNNCTNCGRIVCAQEGSGPCFFCGHLVCSKEEKQKIELGTKQAVKLRNRLLQMNWAPGTETPPYRLKRRNRTQKLTDTPVTNTENEDSFENEEVMDDAELDDLDVVRQTCPSADAQQRLEIGLAAALANRDRLLEYDATSARRTRVYDDELDYFVSEGSGGGAAAWLSAEARERIAQRVAELRAQRHASRLETTRLCLDFAGRSVRLVDTRDEAARRLYQPDQHELDALESTVRPSSGQAQNERESTDIDLGGRMIDPCLNDQILQFVPKLVSTDSTVDNKQGYSNAVMVALHQQQQCGSAELRLQDEQSRQLVDEGYCLSMHQPWASLLVRGIKRDEGRTWYSAHRGCLWIAATSKKPDPDDIRDMERDFLNSGGSRSNLPQSYPTGCLLGRVNVVDVLSQEEYRAKFPDGPSESPYVFVCDDPRELLIKLPITGKHKIYKLEKHVHTAAKVNLA
ncbi:hypothetical protein EG68_09814 [Paragonimus skrjabini miyazakii]|uniref:Activating signal cointegrator 1 n=1 Tax=Paragonimus skrjabini miyazakii TaxID=59628 RepID=A0A8S9Y9G6_9TREM|nr:hypothetical protein EG68_09814 [Paragonimus skrjabini miyazakii]